MSNWRDKLTSMGQMLAQEEKAVVERQTAAVAAFRRRLTELYPVGQEVAQLADAYGVTCEWVVNRFDTRHPGFLFRTLKPLREYGAECRNGTVFIRRDGKESEASLAAIAADLVKDQLMDLVLAVAERTRKRPGAR